MGEPLTISTGELAMANRFGQKLGDFMAQKIRAYAKTHQGLMPADFQVRASVGVAPITGDLEGELHRVFKRILAEGLQ